MTRNGGIAIASGVVGAVIGLVVYTAVLIPPIAARADLPHVYTAKELLATPEGQLIYPGSTVIHEREQDMVPGSLSPEQPALVERELVFTGSPAEVMPWYRDQLEPNGWTPQGKSQSGAYSWSKGRLSFLLAVCGDGGEHYLYPPPCTQHVLASLWAY
jgi:hypothetical protein